MDQRNAKVSRETSETTVSVEIDLDGVGRTSVVTGVGMLDHLLTAFGRHGRFDLTVTATGDLEIDEHHTVEDVGLTLGLAIRKALGGGEGIVRMAHALVPMDEALGQVALDVSGRGYAVVQDAFDREQIGDLGTDLVWHFLDSLARSAGINLHAAILAGRNDHHKAEALFKALGRALDQATQRDPRFAGEMPSTKGDVEITEP